jgi:hypothetical protein
MVMYLNGSMNDNKLKFKLKMKLSTGILRIFISWDMFHKKAQTFHRIAVCEWSERNETSTVIQKDIQIQTQR